MISEDENIDPFQVLEVSYSATEKEIQQAFQAKMQNAQDKESLIKAYGMIRDQSGRNRMRWDTMKICLCDPLENKQGHYDMLALIKELAFLSPWEMGDDACLN